MSLNSDAFVKGYLGNSNLKRSRQEIVWTPERIEEYIRCKYDPIYFAEKYIQIVHVDKGFIPITLYDYQKEIITKIQNSRRVAVVTSRQAGKALSLDTEIPTPNGWSTMEKLQVGDYVFDKDGLPCRVTFKSEIHNKPTYKITFSDNSEVIACEDHLWYGYDYQQSRTDLTTFDTKQLARGLKLYNSEYENRYSIPLCKPLTYSEKELAIDPYVLGLWLGDGIAASGKLVMLEDDFNAIRHLIPYDVDVKRYDKKNQSILYVKIEGLYSKLREAGLLNNKHIPTEYLQSSIDQRRALLKGLMDTDGHSQVTLCEFTQSIKHQNILDSMKELITSLGYKYNIYNYTNTLFPSQTIKFSSHDQVVFNLPRKASKQQLTTHTKNLKRFITNIQLIDSVPTQCIEVDSPSHTFICTRNHVVTHNTTTAAVIILHFILFNDHKRVALLANKGDSAREILDRIKIAYEALPAWLQQGIVEWNKGSISLENGCSVLAATTSSTSIRGKSVNLLYIDETAFCENWDEFFASVYPTISSGTTTKILLTSTPNGLNHFHKICEGAKLKELEPDRWNGYEFVNVPWQNVPGRDLNWYNDTMASMNYDREKFSQEFECEFAGSSGTLISGAVLKNLFPKPSIWSRDGLTIYHEVESGNQYLMVADTSRGKGLDYSAFQIIDVTKMPYQQVAVYRNNMVTPIEYATVIHRLSKKYNDAAVLVENNDVGAQVADVLYDHYEMDNIICTENAGTKGKRITSGYKSGYERGIRTTKTVKSVGCSMLKLLVEQQQLIINDMHTINELNRFSRKGTSYEAESGYNDDLVMCLVLFAWVTDQQYFKELTDINTLIKLREKSEEELENDLLDFYVDDKNEPIDEPIEARPGEPLSNDVRALLGM